MKQHEADELGNNLARLRIELGTMLEADDSIIDDIITKMEEYIILNTDK